RGGRSRIADSRRVERVRRPEHPDPGDHGHQQGDGEQPVPPTHPTTVPTTSPRSTPPARPRMVTVSPSARKVRVDPSASVTGSAPPRVSSTNEPTWSRPGPEIVPEANRS